MHPELQKMLQLDFFKEEGFVRRKCKKCGAYFWSREDRDTCNEYPCEGYSFINSPVGKKMDINEMRNAFLKFFEKHGHTIIPRYPVVARWRDDIYLTIASIADFQPHVTSGEVPPPANPLVISQPSIRLNDLDEVGRSGRHLTMFEMMGHHAFNNHDKVYWAEETVRYCDGFLRSIGVENVVYKEAEWAGGGNAGACLEVIVNGLEVATLVFMNLKESEEGKYEVKGTRYDEMNTKVVDTGYGLERLVWLVNGNETIYDAIFPYAIKAIGEHEKMEYVYAIADHTRALAFMLGDGVVPSNTGVGYLARLLIRRTLRFLDKIESNRSIYEILNTHISYLAPHFPELGKERDRIKEILEIETEKYYETMKRGRAIVKKYASRGRIGIEELIELYDSHGIHPEVVKEMVDIEIPPDFESMVAERHSRAERKKKEQKEYDIETEMLYYEKDYEKEFDAEVLLAENDFVILNRTLFYPEGGGERYDTGFLIQDGKKYRVKKVEKAGKAILHYVDGRMKKGKVHGIIDWERRYAMMRHHTATHIINAAARMTLGSHIWQAGSDLDEKEARLDVTHYKRIGEEEIKKIERRANEIVFSSHPVIKKFMRRDIAEKEYGMRLYQGGAPKSSILRIVDIPGIDAEACGGMHVNNTGEIGIIKIIGTERIQDGVERIRFCAGYRAIEYIEDREKILRKASELLQTEPNKITVAIEKLKEETKRLKKELEEMQKNIGSMKYEEYGGIKIIMQDNLTPNAMRELTKEKAIVISSSSKNGGKVLTIASSDDIPVDCSQVVKAIASELNARGGGRKTIAQVGIRSEDEEKAKKMALDIIKDYLK